MPVRDHAGTLLLLLGALLPLLGVLGDPSGRLVGSELGDVYKHAWSYWHTPHSLSTWPWTESFNAPAGGFLWDVMLAPSLLLIPVTAILGPALTSNLWVFASLLLVGVCSAGLARELGAGRQESGVVGFLAQGAPYLYGYPLTSGVHERLGIWIFPLLIWCMLRIRAGGGRRYWILGCGAYAFVAAGCGVYGIWSLLLVGMCLPFVRQSSKRYGGLLSQVPLMLGIGAISLLLLVGMQVASGPDSLSPQPDRFSMWGVQWQMTFSDASFAELFWPPHVRAAQGVDSGDLLWEQSFVGWTQLAVCILGLTHTKTRWICGIALVFVALSMGPAVEFGGSLLVNPLYFLVAWTLPTFGSVPVPFQMVGVFASLAGIGLIALHGKRTLLLALLVVASMLERVLCLPMGLVIETADAEVSSIYEGVSGGPVLEIPRDYQGRALSPTRSVFAQTSHEQGLGLSISTGVTTWDAFQPIREGISLNWGQDLRCMAAGGFHWLVIDRNSYASPELAREQLTAIQKTLGEPAAVDNELYLFSLLSLGETLDENRFMRPFQLLQSVDNDGQGPPQELRGPEVGIRSGREGSICPLRLSTMPK